jgi:membrane fusion protein, multidrug efflux system
MTDISNSRHSSSERAPRGLVWGLGTTVVIALALVAALGWRRSAGAKEETRHRAAEVAHGAVVRTATVQLSPSVRHLSLLGEARPFAEVTLYAKVSGYLERVLVDRGDHVQKGQLLATIESPETDRAVAAARAEYEQRHVTADRVAKLFAQQFVSSQEADQAKADAAVARERLAALEEQQAYESIRAPLDGTVTARYADPGALMQNAATSQTNALPVLTVSETDRLRVFVYLDQGDAAVVRSGTRAAITSQDHPEIVVPASVTRLSGALDAKTRKMVAELDVNNGDGRIVPGGFVQVVLDVPSPARPQAPAEALVVRGSSTLVGLIDSTAHVHLVPVTVASNDGKTVMFASGVAPGQRIALSLGGTVTDGALVQLADSLPTATTGRRP